MAARWIPIDMPGDMDAVPTLPPPEVPLLINRSLCIVAVLLLTTTVPSRAQSGAGEPCGDCHSTGRVAHDHSAASMELENDGVVELCSVFLRGDEPNLGLDWTPCLKCKMPALKAAAEKEWNRAVGQRREFLDGRKQVEDKIGHPTMFVKTKHFVLLWDLPEIKVDRRIYRQHEAMHLYAKRAEELYSEVLAMLGIEEHDMVGTTHYLYLFERLKDAKELAPMLVQMPIGGGQKVSKIGAPVSVMVSWDDPEKIRGDDEVRHQFFVHSVSHHIHNDVKVYTFWLFKSYGWVYEGLAYLQETRQFGSPLVNCSQETGGTANWKGKCWETNVRKALIAGEAPPFQQVISKGADQLSDMERQFSWSYIDYLMWENPNKMPQLLALMKGSQLPTRDCLEQAYGLTIGQFIDNWTAFVRKEYTATPYKGPKKRTPKVPPHPGD